MFSALKNIVLPDLEPAWFVGLRLVCKVANGATVNAEVDIARPSKLLGLTSPDWTMRHRIARVDIAAPDQTEVYNFYAAWNII